VQRIKIVRHVVILTIRQIFFGVRLAWSYSLKKKAPKRVYFILCEHRTGSNLLISYLNSVPGVSSGYEILSRYQTFGLRRWWISRKMIFRHIRHSLNYRCQEVRGAKIFFVHLQELGLSLDDLLKEFPEARWFVLYRKNILAQYLSYKIANGSQRWTRHKNSPPAGNVHIKFDPCEAVKYRDRMKSCYRAAGENPLLRERSLWISYEDLVKDPQAFFDEKVFPFLKLLRHRIHTNLVKQNLKSPSEVICNYDEVREMIEQTDFTQSYEPGIYSEV